MPPFECRREIVLTATPGQIWAAVATPEGLAGWLFPNDVAPGKGSKLPDGISTTTAWEPGQRVTVRSEQGDWFNEIDFVIEWNGRLLPIEVKSALRPRLADARAITSFVAEYADQCRFGVVLYPGNEVRVLSRTAVAVPLSALA